MAETENWIDRFEQRLWYRIVKLILPGLAICGLAFAVWDNYDTNRISQGIVEKISTQFVGYFPLQMEKIVERIENAKKQITIVVDQPAYGCFSNPSQYTNYYIQLMSKISSTEFANFKKLKIICYDEDRRRQELRKQFNIALDLEMDTIAFDNYIPLKSDITTWQSKVIAFNPDSLNKIRTFNRLFTLIEEKNKSLLTQLCNELGNKFELTEVSELEESLPLFFWMFDDDNSAFLSFRSYGPLTTEVTISTSDPSILIYLQSIVSDIGNEKKEQSPLCEYY